MAPPPPYVAMLQGREEAGRDVYQYQPLQGHTCIRVIQLLPSSSFDDPLRCRLIHVDRTKLTLEIDESKNHYYAVSYAWGQHAFSHRLSIIEPNNSSNSPRVLAITPAVECLLRRFRENSHGVTTNLWIDAVCLNQKDRAEVQEQVFLMGRIYSEARGVRIWLGPEDDDVAKVFAFLRHLSSVSYMSDSGRFEDLRSSPNEPLIDDSEVASTIHEVFSKGDYEPLKPLEDFFARRYFTRRWVLQEVALNSRAKYLANKWSVPAYEIKPGLEVFASYIARNSSYRGQFAPNSRSRRGLETLTGLNKNGKLLDNLWHYHDSECYNPSDRIVALCGFSIEHLEWSERRVILAGVEVEYDRGASHIYQAFVQYYLGRGKEFGYLFEHIEAFGSLRDSVMGGPSWCPDWSRTRREAGWRPKIYAPLATSSSARNEDKDPLKGPRRLLFFGNHAPSIAMQVHAFVVEHCLTIHRDQNEIETLIALAEFLRIDGRGPSLTQGGIYWGFRRLLGLDVYNVGRHRFANCLDEYFSILKTLNIAMTHIAKLQTLKSRFSCSFDCVGQFCRALSSFVDTNSVFLAADKAKRTICIGTTSKVVESEDLILAEFEYDLRDPWKVEEFYILRRPVYRVDRGASLTETEILKLDETWPGSEPDKSANWPKDKRRRREVEPVYVCWFHTIAKVQPLNWEARASRDSPRNSDVRIVLR